ncbi:hypothetical protein AB0C96_32825 [Streptomyces sp. NPDC048506]|uniref:hypothetical protein n=1 Tax=Streptomyces sp. NPDC048506 TaxID=3155028 RepID=UPI0034434F9C
MQLHEPHATAAGRPVHRAGCIQASPIDSHHPTTPDDAVRAAFLALLRAENQGIRRLEQLDGNIDYLDMRWIADAGEGGRATGPAMELAAHTRAPILDLRECRGGEDVAYALRALGVRWSSGRRRGAVRTLPADIR